MKKPAATPAKKATPRAPSDLALDQDDTGTRFVGLVVIMMSALATIAMGGALVVHGLRASWTGAMTGHATIEIPAAANGAIRSTDTLAGIAQDVREALAKSPDVTSARVISRGEVEKLVGPWLGSNAETTGAGNDLPLPALVAVMMEDAGDADATARIAQLATQADAGAITETHQSWVSDLKRFSLVLLTAAFAMAGVTIVCSILSVAGAVKARLSAHHSDIDLLHVMGATDDYIGGQFVRVVVRSVGRAALIGAVLGLVFLKIIALVAGEMQSAMLPALRWDVTAFLWFAACPALVTGLCYMAAKATVLRTLRVMP